MKILEVLTYYRPHVSGLTIYVERLSKALVQQGHEVTVLTSQYEPELPRLENLGGVHVERVPVAFRVSKGVIMPTFGFRATHWSRWADVMHLHLPQFDAPGLALRGRLFSKPVVLTYHCDLQLPSGLFNRIVNEVVWFMNRRAGDLADAVVTYTRDYGTHSPFLSRYLGEKLYIIPPPVELVACPASVAESFARRHRLQGRKVIGISARIATEKGIEVLLAALPQVAELHPEVLVLHANPQALGENDYAKSLQPLFALNKDRYLQLGSLHGAELTAFYQNLDALVVSSLNSTESFGLVQVEAMMNGVPVAASNLPGVRQPVTMTGMGEVTPIGDSAALAQALIRILDRKEAYHRPGDIIADSFSPAQTAREYVRLFHKLQHGQIDSIAVEPEAYDRLRALNDPTQNQPGREV
jgi:glycosyltransferase involved in cell wall biosynthesis